MARTNLGPWYYKQKRAWYFWHEGKRISLKVKGESNEAEAIRAWHRLLGSEQTHKPKPIREPKPTTVKELVEAYLADVRLRVKANSFANYIGHLQPFADKHGSLKAEAMNLPTAYAFCNRKEWSSSYRYGFLGSLATAYRWGEANGFIRSNPLKGMKRPAKASRGIKAIISTEDFGKLLSEAPERGKSLLIVLRETGARPSEISRLEATHIDFANSVAILQEHKTDASGKPRLIMLSPLAMSILKPLAESRPKGVLLLSERGRAWRKRSIWSMVRKASDKAGVKAIAYGLRHTFATDALAKGVPDATVAALLGHSGTAMLHKHYSHLTHQATVMREALQRVRG